MKKGESFSLHYRVLLHQGDTAAGKVAEAFAEYAKTDRQVAMDAEQPARARPLLGLVRRLLGRLGQ